MNSWGSSFGIGVRTLGIVRVVDIEANGLPRARRVGQIEVWSDLIIYRYLNAIDVKANNFLRRRRARTRFLRRARLVRRIRYVLDVIEAHVVL